MIVLVFKVSIIIIYILMIGLVCLNMYKNYLKPGTYSIEMLNNLYYHTFS